MGKEFDGCTTERGGGEQQATEQKDDSSILLNKGAVQRDGRCADAFDMRSKWMSGLALVTLMHPERSRVQQPFHPR
jgi:hypothetical protein